MSELINFIQESKKAQNELISTTIRMPKETYFFIEDFADSFTLSRQEAMLKLLNEGVSVAKAAEEKLSKSNETDKLVRFHLLNTNKRNSDSDHEMMLREQIAAAFYTPWKEQIDRIEDGDYVFLYESGVGIVAFGKAAGKTQTQDHEGDKDQCFYKKLNQFIKLKTPLPAREIRKILNRNVFFYITRAGVPDGQKILDKISGLNR